MPSPGGNTLFAGGYAAYETLPRDIRAKFEGRAAFHHDHYGSTQRGDGCGMPAFAESRHPVFRTHDKTGRKAVYVNRPMTVGIADVAKEESDPLLATVRDHAERGELVDEHVRRPGDLLVWDNRRS